MDEKHNVDADAESCRLKDNCTRGFESIRKNERCRCQGWNYGNGLAQGRSERSEKRPEVAESRISYF